MPNSRSFLGPLFCTPFGLVCWPLPRGPEVGLVLSSARKRRSERGPQGAGGAAHGVGAAAHMVLAEPPSGSAESPMVSAGLMGSAEPPMSMAEPPMGTVHDTDTFGAFGHYLSEMWTWFTRRAILDQKYPFSIMLQSSFIAPNVRPPENGISHGTLYGALCRVLPWHLEHDSQNWPWPMLR